MEKIESREGYKKTELGWVPVEWEIRQFGDVISEMKSGLSRRLSFCDIGLPVIRSNNIVESGIDFSDIKYWFVDDPQGSETSTYFIKDNDILLNFINSLAQIGKCAKFINKLNRNIIYTTNVMRVKLNDKILTDYFLYITKTKNYNDFIASIAKPAVNQASFTIGDFKSYIFSLPPLPEQQKIARLLSCWDKAIEKTEKLINAKNKLKKGLMQKLLTGKKRFKEFIVSPDRYNTEFGKLPVDWNYIEIKNIAEEVKLRNTDSKSLTVLSCTKYKGLVDSLEYFGKQIFSKDTSDYKLVKRNQFAYATNHIEEGSIGYQNLYNEALISPMYTVFETYKEKVNDAFLYRLLKTDTYIHIFKSRMIGSIDRRGGLRWKEFSKIKVPLPTIPEQQKIASVLSTCDREMKLLEKKLNSLKNQKKGLMQKLLTGQIRVSVV